MKQLIRSKGDVIRADKHEQKGEKISSESNILVLFHQGGENEAKIGYS